MLFGTLILQHEPFHFRHLCFSGAAMMIAALAAEAGLPAGVLNIIHGNHVSLCLEEAFITTSSERS